MSFAVKKDIDISYIEKMLGKIVMSKIVDDNDARFYHVSDYIMSELLSILQKEKKED